MRRAATLAPLALAAGIYIAWAARFIHATAIDVFGVRYPTLFDDAMIALRYASNLAHGHGLVWNPGQRVEGFTSPLMVLLMTLPSLFLERGAAVLAVQWLGVGCVLATACVSFAVGKRVFATLPPPMQLAGATAAFLATLAYYPLSFWALEGMETGLVALLATSSLLVALRVGERRSLGFGVLLALLVCTRPDALVQALVLLGFRALTLPATRRRVIVVELGVFVALLAIVTLARRRYFGAWLPNTYYLKLGGYPLALRLHNGALFLRGFVEQLWPIALVALVGVVIARRLLPALLLLLLASATAYQCWAGGDPWPLWRIMTPYVPLAIVVAAWSVASLSSRLPRVGALLGLLSIVVSLSVCVQRADRPWLQELLLNRAPYLYAENRKNVQLAVALARVTKPGAKLALVAAGAIGYYADREGIDILGKTDAVIAHRAPDLGIGRQFAPAEFFGMTTVPGHNKHDLRYSIVMQRPDYTQTASWGNDSVADFVNANYERVGRLTLLRNSQFIDWDALARLRADGRLP